MDSEFVLPALSREDGIWGPPDTDDLYDLGLEVVAFNKAERVTRIADFLHDEALMGGGYMGGASGRGGAGGSRAAFGTAAQSAGGAGGGDKANIDKGAFRTVDNAAKVESLARKKRDQTALPKVTRGGAGGNFTGGRGGQFSRGGGTNASVRGGRNTGRGSSGHHQSGGRGSGRGGNKRPYVPRITEFKQPTVALSDEHTILETYILPELLKKNTVDIPAATNLYACGQCRYYDGDVETQATARKPVNLKTFPDVSYTNVTTFDDPIMRQLVKQHPGGKPVVLATESILATLMTAPKSVNGWDIRMQKFQNFIFLDKRDDEECNIETQWVSETMPFNPPNDTDPSSINAASKLAQESTAASRHFGTHALVSKVHHMPGSKKSPFAGPKASPTLYRYRQFTVNANTPDEYDVIVRCTIDAAAKRDGEEQLLRLYGLLEYQAPDTSSWKSRIDNQRGALLVTEVKNNAFKFAKWTAMAVLSGADLMKIAFIARANPESRDKHEIIAVESKKPVEFATQIGLNIQNMWSVLDTIVTKYRSVETEPTVKAGLVKDPNRTMLQMFLEPDVDDDDDDDEEEDDDDEDDTDDEEDEDSDDE